MTKLRKQRRKVILDFFDQLDFWGNANTKSKIETYYQNVSTTTLRVHATKLAKYQRNNPYLVKMNNYLMQSFQIANNDYYAYESGKYQILRRFENGLIVIIGDVCSKENDFTNKYLWPKTAALFIDDKVYHVHYENWGKDFIIYTPNRGVRNIGFDDYQLFYSSRIRTKDKLSESIIKEIEDFKYLNIDQLQITNYYKLLQWDSDTIYELELMQKAGYHKLITAYFDGERIDKKVLMLMAKDKSIGINPSYNTYLDYQNDNTEKIENKENLTRNQKLEKTYEEYVVGGFIMRTPKSIKDLKEEGKELNHCVSSYLDSIVNDNKRVYFLRTTDKPKDPFYTVEISNNKLVQVRTKDNATNDYYTDVVRKIALENNLIGAQSWQHFK